MERSEQAKHDKAIFSRVEQWRALICKKDVAIRENHNLYFEREIVKMNALCMITSIFLVFCAVGFMASAWKKREDMSNVIGNTIAATFMALSVFLIWR